MKQMRKLNTDVYNKPDLLLDTKEESTFYSRLTKDKVNSQIFYIVPFMKLSVNVAYLIKLPSLGSALKCLIKEGKYN